MNRRLRTIIISATTACLAQACDPLPTDSEDVSDMIRYRFATFNIAMGLSEPGLMAAALQSTEDPRLELLAAILQTVRPDVVLLNEFDYDPAIDAAGLLNRNYLERAGDDREPLAYPYSLYPPVNTGVDSGFDLDANDTLGEPTDAWGYGTFPGQYGMLILSKFPIDEGAVRSFQKLRWSELPGALRPMNENGTPYYPDEIWSQLRLSSKSHLDVPIDLGEHTVHLLASHPTPPVFDGPEDRNGMRNHDELKFWAHYISEHESPWIVDDSGHRGGLAAEAAFIIAGDLNADPVDGDARRGAIAQLLDHTRVDSSCVPESPGGAEATAVQKGINLAHRGDPAADTSDFNDETVGNYRLDYLLPSRDIETLDCGVLWPESNAAIHEAATFSDHRLVWIDVAP